MSVFFIKKEDVRGFGRDYLQCDELMLLLAENALGHEWVMRKANTREFVNAVFKNTSKSGEGDFSTTVCSYFSISDYFRELADVNGFKKDLDASLCDGSGVDMLTFFRWWLSGLKKHSYRIDENDIPKIPPVLIGKDGFYQYHNVFKKWTMLPYGSLDCWINSMVSTIQGKLAELNAPRTLICYEKIHGTFLQHDSENVTRKFVKNTYENLNFDLHDLPFHDCHIYLDSDIKTIVALELIYYDQEINLKVKSL